MKTKRQIDRQRESAITLKVGGKEDNSSIREFVSTSSALYTITELAVYAVRLADDIDPERSNPNIPNLSQKVVPAGYGDEVVGRVILTAKSLFDEKNATVGRQIGGYFEATIELANHILELRGMIGSLRQEISAKEQGFVEEQQQIHSYTIPSVTDLKTKIHNILVKVDKSKDATLKLYQEVFLPDRSSRPTLEEYDQVFREIPNMPTEYISAWEENRNFWSLVRNIRNCSEHPKKGYQILISDFQMHSNGEVTSPLIEVEHSKTPFGLLPVVEFVQFLEDMTLGYAELSHVFIKSVELLDKKTFNERVSEVPEQNRRHPYVRFYRTIEIGGTERILG
ncbi:hypothetical protein ACFOY8_05230 [Thalassospira xianhensis]|uniref:Uncharacterized protein n=1 Tax=Thalassospira xianhensis MCCC 1A02616 TaxID=1177929 RepID=A0A367U8A7_9PROT|nr:hypothetical protein [Thalassospira xianhensis]RCK04339.1 hypothetical protein TH5_20465 [Thalassospira xianhensis MCCC 1A02616]